MLSLLTLLSQPQHQRHRSILRIISIQRLERYSFLLCCWTNDLNNKRSIQLHLFILLSLFACFERRWHAFLRLHGNKIIQTTSQRNQADINFHCSYRFKLSMLTPNRRYKIPPSSTRHSSSESHSHRQAYLGFKEKLLRAMAELDPLDLLESGIFEEYEAYLGITTIDVQPKEHVFRQNVSDFQSVLHCYELSDDVSITQLERRSLSCEKISAEDRALRRMQEQRNIQFVLFANSCGFLSNKIPEDKAIQHLDQRINHLRNELAEKDTENNRLSERLRETESRLQQLRHVQPSQNDKTDKELQYLLKEKQLMKKLHDARVQAEQLRSALEQAEDKLQKNGSKALPILQQAQQDVGNLQNLREKVINQGRMRSLLAQISGMQLNMRCGLEGQAGEKQ